MMRLLSKIKSWLAPRGVRPRRVLLGLYRGLTLEIDLANATQLYLGLWERETHPYLRRAANRCEWAIDVGAGKGEHCLLLLKHSPVQRIYALEPQRSEVERLRRNLGLNGLEGTPRLVVLNKFAGCGPADDFVPVDALEVDRQRRGFVKIDVDGAEMEVLNSGAGLFAEAPVDLLLETHSRELERDCLAFLSTKGFQCRVIRQAWWRVLVPEMRPIEHNQWLWATRD